MEVVIQGFVGESRTNSTEQCCDDVDVSISFCSVLVTISAFAGADDGVFGDTFFDMLTDTPPSRRYEMLMRYLSSRPGSS